MFFIYLDLKHNKADINGNMMELNSVLENISEKRILHRGIYWWPFQYSFRQGRGEGGRGGGHVLKSQTIVEEM